MILFQFLYLFYKIKKSITDIQDGLIVIILLMKNHNRLPELLPVIQQQQQHIFVKQQKVICN